MREIYTETVNPPQPSSNKEEKPQTPSSYSFKRRGFLSFLKEGLREISTVIFFLREVKGGFVQPTIKFFPIFL